MCFENNQQANGIQGKQQSENVQEVIKNRKYNLGQKCWENCILGKYFSKHRSSTGSFLSPFPWKQCCCVFKRRPDPWAFVGSNIELGEGVFFPQRRRLEIVLLRGKVDVMGKLSQVVLSRIAAVTEYGLKRYKKIIQIEEGVQARRITPSNSFVISH